MLRLDVSVHPFRPTSLPWFTITTASRCFCPALNTVLIPTLPVLRGAGAGVGEGARDAGCWGAGVFVGGGVVGVLEGLVAGTTTGAGVGLGSSVGDGFCATAGAVACCSVGADAAAGLAEGWFVNTRTINNVVTTEMTTLTSITVIHCLGVRGDGIGIEYITIASDWSIALTCT
jgi:hypothetical protein